MLIGILTRDCLSSVCSYNYYILHTTTAAAVTVALGACTQYPKMVTFDIWFVHQLIISIECIRAKYQIDMNSIGNQNYADFGLFTSQKRNSMNMMKEMKKSS